MGCGKVECPPGTGILPPPTPTVCFCVSGLSKGLLQSVPLDFLTHLGALASSLQASQPPCQLTVPIIRTANWVGAQSSCSRAVLAHLRLPVPHKALDFTVYLLKKRFVFIFVSVHGTYVSVFM